MKIQIIYELSKDLKFCGFSVRIAWRVNQPRSQHTGLRKFLEVKRILSKELA